MNQRGSKTKITGVSPEDLPTRHRALGRPKSSEVLFIELQVSMCLKPAQIECNTLFTGMEPLSPSIPSDYSLPFHTDLKCYTERSLCP